MAKILVVDDEPAVRKAAVAILLKDGHEVSGAEGGQEGVEKFRGEGGFDLVIMDMLMPGMSGTDATAAIRGVDPNVRVLFYSGTEAGPPGEYFLRKPFSLDELRIAVSEALGE